MCNKEIKFKVFLEEAEKRGFDYIAMGHYAKIESSVQSFSPSPQPSPLEEREFRLLK
jgi:tRNA U34 2-thiouridine synthase MnmA/TrmU